MMSIGIFKGAAADDHGRLALRKRVLELWIRPHRVHRRGDGESLALEELATTAGSKAKLVKGRAIPPEDAPKRVQKVIAAANKIRNKPYKYGGGHGDWDDSGYDCSGSVSYALRGARLVKRPMSSGEYTSWGRRGRGDWITVYAHGGHAYAVIAGLRLDTDGTSPVVRAVAQFDGADVGTARTPAGRSTTDVARRHHW